MNLIMPQDPLVKQLIDRFGIPKTCNEFHIHVMQNAVVTVTCDFYPESGSDEPITTKQYHLVEIKDQYENERC